MATSTNYGWAEPDNSSLVKNGASDIRTLGNAIDASLWNVGYGQAGKNRIINGAFDIWQRGTSSSTLGAYTTADRWYMTAISGTGTFAQETSVKPATSNYSLKFTASATAQPLIYQVIETANAVQFAGQNVTLSGKFAASTTVTYSLSLEYSNSTDVGMSGSWTSITPTSTSAASPTTTTFVSGSRVFAVPSTARSLRVGILPTATIANGVVLYFSEIQLEVGSTATPFSRNASTIQGETAACQRYYYQNALGVNFFTTGAVYSTTAARYTLPNPVTMRTTPTGLVTQNLTVSIPRTGGTVNTGTWAITYATPNTTTVTYTHGSAVLTAGDVAEAYGNNANSYIGWSAEL